MTMLFKVSLSLVLLNTGLVASDYLIPTYPGPADLNSNSSSVLKAWHNITSDFDKLPRVGHLHQPEPVSGIDNITFSIGLFSLNDPRAIQLQYHHTSPETSTAEHGTREVDAHSIYRIASVSKLITVLSGMIELTEDDWNRPLSQIIPYFVQDRVRRVAVPNSTRKIQWDKVTLWSLATQLSGIPTIALPIGDLYSPQATAEWGAPEVNISAWSACEVRYLADQNDQYCSAEETIALIDGLLPNFLPWSTPVYSDLNFMLLGVALSNLTGKSISTIYRSSVFNPLDMKSTIDSHPTDSAEIARSVIVGAPEANFAAEPVITTPSGGILSTISDLQKLGLGILNSTLLPPGVTRKWMMPVSHTSSLSYSIGAPWEIHRFVHPGSGKVTDLYTKLGDSGFYGGSLVLVPEYETGFAFLNAGTDGNRTTKAFKVLDHVTSNILPALERQAVMEAKKNFVGSYKFSSENFSVTLEVAFNASTFPEVNSNLVLTKWNYNGTNVLTGPFFKGQQLRLEQSIPGRANSTSVGTVAFQLSANAQTSTYQDAMKIPESSVYGPWTGFYLSNGDFAFTDNRRWAGFPASTLLFDIDAKGKAITCTLPADRVTLKRV
ncbi:hypothetical protein N7481_011952 [Penicillium waksmanii]|uniref:uncharacterized protein n=1 Tax=Penicillium waksmanii TaxID=69791 RepID=UPI002548E169|nr:uncharacterized protein N7481_011952 [Penicillium waksmanii]KAJ5965238.1 hypothetical protein N7481_011952 [Penicillium waksmanii]